MLVMFTIYLVSRRLFNQIYFYFISQTYINLDTNEIRLLGFTISDTPLNHVIEILHPVEPLYYRVDDLEPVGDVPDNNNDLTILPQHREANVTYVDQRRQPIADPPPLDLVPNEIRDHPHPYLFNVDDNYNFNTNMDHIFKFMNIPVSIDCPSSDSQLANFQNFNTHRLFNTFANHQPVRDYITLNQFRVQSKFQIQVDNARFFHQEVIKIVNGTTLTIDQYNFYLRHAQHLVVVNNRNGHRFIHDATRLVDSRKYYTNQIDYKLFFSKYDTAYGPVYLSSNFMKDFGHLFHVKFNDNDISNIRTDYASLSYYYAAISKLSVLGKHKDREGVLKTDYDIDLELMHKSYPYKFTKVPVDQIEYHPHPNGHFTRSFNCTMMYNDASNCGAAHTMWVHVGENLGRLLRHDVPGHAINAVVDSYDHIRQSNYLHYFQNELMPNNIKNYRFTTVTTACFCGYNGSLCTHVARYRNHILQQDPQVLDYTLFYVHSAYYVPICSYVKYHYINVNLYPKNAQVHTNYPFNNGEGMWFRDNSGIVLTKVNGNSAQYTHKDFTIGDVVFYSDQPLPESLVIEDDYGRSKYIVEVLARVDYTHNSDVVLKFTKVPFKTTPIRNMNVTANKVVQTIPNQDLVQMNHSLAASMLNVPVDSQMLDLDVSSPFFLDQDRFYRAVLRDGKEIYTFNGSLAVFNTYSNQYYHKIVSINQTLKDHNWLIRSMAEAIAKSDFDELAKIKRAQYTKEERSDPYQYSDLLTVCEFLAYKLYFESVTTKFNYVKNSWFNMTFMINTVQFIFVIVVMSFWVHALESVKPTINNFTPSGIFIIDPLSHLLDHKVSWDGLFQAVLARSQLFTSAYQLHLVGLRQDILLIIVVFLELLTVGSDYGCFLISLANTLVINFVAFKSGLKTLYSILYRHSGFLVTYIMFQLFCPVYSMPIQYASHCSFSKFSYLLLTANNLLNFLNSKKEVIDSKPTLALSYKDKINKPRVCTFDNHRYDNLTQICPNVVGLIKPNIPCKLHDCPVTSISAISRNMVKRSDYDEKVVFNFKQFVDDRFSKIDFNYIDYHFNEVINDMGSLYEFINKNYAGSQKQEYLDAYKSLFTDCKPVQLSTMKAHVKIDEMQYMTESPKDRNITAQNSLAKVTMLYITNLCAKIYKRFDPAYSSGMNFMQRENKLEQVLALFNDPVEIDIDGSGYDSTQYAILKTIVDVPIYTYILYLLRKTDLLPINEGAVFHTIANQLQNVYNPSIDVSYTVLGTVASGMMSTSDGNTRRSSLYIRYGLRSLKEGKDYFVEALGDDIKIITNRSLASRVVSLLKQEVYVNGSLNNLGQIAKYIDVVDISQGNFISTTTLVRDGVVKMVRQFDRVLSSFAFSIKVTGFTSNISAMYKIFLLNISKYYSMMDWCRGITFYEVLANYHLKYAQYLASKYHFNFVYSQNILSQYRSTKDKTRFSLYKGNFDNEFEQMLLDKYKIFPNDLKDLIYQLENADFTHDIKSPIIDLINSQDYNMERLHLFYSDTNKLNNRYRTLKNHIKDKSEFFIDGCDLYRLHYPEPYIKKKIFRIRVNLDFLGYECLQVYYKSNTLRESCVALNNHVFSVPHLDKKIFKCKSLSPMQLIIINLNESN